MIERPQHLTPAQSRVPSQPGEHSENMPLRPIAVDILEQSTAARRGVKATYDRVGEVLSLLTPEEDEPNPVTEVLTELVTGQQSHTAMLENITRRLTTIEVALAQLVKRSK